MKLRPCPTAAILLALALCILLAPALFPSTYYFRIGTLVFINGLAVVGLVILLGYAGQISLGHAGFLGIGAYAAAIVPASGLPPSLAIVAGAVVSGLIAFVIGRPIMRLKGHYLAVATLGFGILVGMVLSNEAQWTGGPDGMGVETLGLRDALGAIGITLRTAVAWYWFSGLILVAGAWIALNLLDSPSGRALRALHDSEIAAQVIGVDVARAKLAAFVLSAVYASVAGSLLAQFNRFITPDVAGFLHSIELVTMAVLGGAGTVAGGIFGAALLTLLPQALTVLHDYKHMALGLIMILVMIFMRNGLLPTLVALAARRKR